jgi:hypothetical protein
MPHRVLPKARSVYRVLVGITIGIVSLSSLLIGIIFYQHI